MRASETVTFGGSGLNRCAELRVNAAELSQSETAAHIALWNGKILARNGCELVRLERGEGILDHSNQAPIFLGEDQGKLVFAHEVSDWTPVEGSPDTLGAFSDPSRQHVPGLEEEIAFCELRAIMADLTHRDAELAASAKANLDWHSSHKHCARCGAASLPAEGGWRRDCPKCGTQHFPRTDPVVIMLITFENSVLVGRSPGWPEGMYSLLAGFVEPGEPIEAAVRREVAEEAGISVGPVKYLASQPWPFPTSLMFGCWGEATTNSITVDKNELDDAIWVTREEMLDIFAERHAHIHAPRRGSIARFVLEAWLKDRLD